VRTRLLNLVLLLALALASQRLWEFLSEPAPVLPAPAARPAPAPAVEAEPAAAAPEGAAGASRAEGYDVIVARDLFSATRGVVPPAPVAAARPVAKPQPPPKLTLSGVVILDGERSAFLQEGTGDARPRKVKEGERFAGGTVTAIRPDGVTFQFGGADVVIPLRTPKDAPPGAAAPATGAVPRVGAATTQDPRAGAQAPFPRRFVQPSTQPPGNRVGVPGATPAPGVPQFVPAPVVPDDGEGDEEEVAPDDGEEFNDEDLPPDTEDDPGAE
jgi:hypothetical protein